MNNIDSLSTEYIDIMERWLKIIRAEIASQAETVIGNTSSEKDWDLYLEAINSFYYKSFNEHFFPQYKKQIKDIITSLYDIKLTEQNLKKCIADNLVHYAGFYNQVKLLEASLESLRHFLRQSRTNWQNQWDRLNLETKYDIEQVVNNFTGLQTHAQILLQASEETELVEIIRFNPEYKIILEILVSLDFSSPELIDKLKRLQVCIHDAKNMLNQLYINYNQDILDKIVTNINDLTGNRHTPELAMLYNYILIYRVLPRIEMLQIIDKDSNRLQIRRAISEVTQHLEKCQVLLDKSLKLMYANKTDILRNVFTVYQHKTNDLENLNSMLSSATQLLTDIAYQADQTQNKIPNFLAFYEQVYAAITPLYNELKVKCKTTKYLSPMYDPLKNSYDRISFELEYFFNRLDALYDHHKRVEIILNQLDTADKDLVGYLQQLYEVKIEVEKFLAPRNLERTWKDLAVKIEKFPLDKKGIPDKYASWAKDYYSHRSDKNGQDITIKEPGSIFVIKVDDEIREEIPHLPPNRRIE